MTRRQCAREMQARFPDKPVAVRMRVMSEIIFLVEDAPDGGLSARAVGESIFTQAATRDELHERVRDAVRCHFDAGSQPKMIRLHFVRDEVIAA
jgi:hypothetical protein